MAEQASPAAHRGPTADQTVSAACGGPGPQQGKPGRRKEQSETPTY